MTRLLTAAAATVCLMIGVWSLPLHRRARRGASTMRRCARRIRPNGSGTAATTPRRTTAPRSDHKANVASLKPAWTAELGTPAGAIEATPLVSDGVMYVTGPWSTVVALDARTGAVQLALGSGAAAAGRSPAVLRPGQPRRGAVRRQGVRRPARHAARRAGCGHRQGRVGDPDLDRPRRCLLDHRRAPRREGKGDHRQRRRRTRRSRLCLGLRRADGHAGVALLHRPWQSGERIRTPGARDGGEDLDRRVVAGRRRRHRLGRHGLRRRSRSALRRHRQRQPLGARHPQPRRRRQSVPVVDPGDTPRHRPAGLAFPAGARRAMGLHRDAADDPGQLADRRPSSARC